MKLVRKRRTRKWGFTIRLHPPEMLGVRWYVSLPFVFVVADKEGKE